jgi:hypothetical protein
MFSFTDVNIFTIFIFVILFLILLFFLIFKITLIDINNKFKYLFLSLWFTLLMFTVFYPRWIIKDTSHSGTSEETVFLLDITKSMNALDIKSWIRSGSRLNASKYLMSNYLQRNKKWLYWLVVFAWNTRVISPMTNDYEQLDIYIKWLNQFNDNWDWTNLVWALNTASSMFTSTSISRKIVLFTDWWHENPNLNPLSRDLKVWNINLQIIWLWWDKKVKIPIWEDVYWNNVYKTYLWELVLTSINKKIINNLIGFIKNSSVYYVWNLKKTDKILSEIDSKINSLELSSKIKWKIDLSRYFAMISFIFFMIYLTLRFVENRKTLKIK